MPKPVAPEVKAAALADILAGMSVNAAAKKHGVSRAAITDWVNQSGVATPVLQGESLDRVGAALERLMVASLDVLTEQVLLTRKVPWLEKHGVSGYVELHRVHAEGIARVVEAQEMGAAAQEPTPIRRVS